MTDVTCVFGRQGSGKTTYSRCFAGKHKRVLVWDPQHEWSTFPGYQGVDSVNAAARIIETSRSFKIAFRSPPFGMMDSAHKLALMAWTLQEAARADLLLVIDECNNCFPPGRMPAAAWALPACVLQGRHRRIGMLAISQRPALVSLDLRANARRTVFFGIAGQDRKAAAMNLPRAEVEAVGRLPNHTYIVEECGQVSTGRNPPMRSAPRPTSRSAAGTKSTSRSTKRGVSRRARRP